MIASSSTKLYVCHPSLTFKQLLKQAQHFRLRPKKRIAPHWKLNCPLDLPPESAAYLAQTVVPQRRVSKLESLIPAVVPGIISFWQEPRSREVARLFFRSNASLCLWDPSHFRRVPNETLWTCAVTSNRKREKSSSLQGWKLLELPGRRSKTIIVGW